MARQPGKSIKLADTIWVGGKLTFKKRYPVSVTSRHPDKKGKFFQRSLGTSDEKAASAAHAEAVRAFHEEVRRLSEPTPDERLKEWLSSLKPAQVAQVVKLAEDQLGRRTKKVYKPGFPYVSHAGDGPRFDDWVAVETDDPPPNGNPFLAPAVPVVDDPWTLEEAVSALIEEAERLPKEVAESSERNASHASSPSAAARERRWTQTGSRAGDLIRKTSRLLGALEAAGFPRDCIPTAAQSIEPRMPAAKFTLRDALAERAKDCDERYRGQMEWSVTLFEGIVGKSELDSLELKDLHSFEVGLRRWPTATSVRNAVLQNRKTVQQVLEATAPTSGATLAPKAIAKHVATIRSLTKLAAGRGLALNARDPFASFQATRTRARGAPRMDFSADELDKLFSAMRSEWLPRHKDRVWICLLALFHGARREEICQLLKTDIRETGGVWCLHITTMDDEDGAQHAKKLKTEKAERVIPIHARIIDAGFLAYVEASPGPRVFASLTQDSDNRWGGNFGKSFSRLLRDHAGVGGARRARTFHSFRHTAITAMRDAEWPYQVQLALSGHAPGGSTNDAYGGAPSPSTAKPWVDKIAYRSKSVDAILMEIGQSPGASTGVAGPKR